MARRWPFGAGALVQAPFLAEAAGGGAAEARMRAAKREDVRTEYWELGVWGH